MFPLQKRGQAKIKAKVCGEIKKAIKAKIEVAVSSIADKTSNVRMRNVMNPACSLFNVAIHIDQRIFKLPASEE